MESCLAIANQKWLLEEFISVLEGYRPADVFDVGCGAGQLLRLCGDRGIKVKGLDQAGPRLDSVAADGFDVLEGSAYELPLTDQQVDWAVMRHVPHHLEDPSRAFKELLRVAKSGVLIAEPCFDETVESQRGAVLADLWEKTQHRRRGMYHEPVYSLGALLDLMPAGFEQDFSVEVHSTLRMRSRSIDDFETEARELVEGLETNDPNRTSMVALFAELKRSGLSWNGSLLLALKRR